MLACARKQAVVGVCFSGIERLPEGQRPARETVLAWYAQVRQIEERNKVLNAHSVEACRYFERQGFKACVLKGQGNAAMYPWPLRRQSGDIDIWCVAAGREKKEKKKGNTKSVHGCIDLGSSRIEVLRWARQRYPKEEYDMKHIHFPIIPNVPMEMHFVPSQLRSPIANRKLIRYYEKAAEMQHHVKLDGVEDKLGDLNCPTIEFNLVFQLTHIFNHFLSEGVGLRQVMDYYVLLASPRTPLRREREEEAVSVIKGIGLYGFAQALMWVMHEVLALREEEMIAPMDEKRGRVLLDEILAGGNFGQYESRYWYNGMSKWKFYLARMRRMVHFLRYYPSEVLWDLPFRIRQRIWMVYTRFVTNQKH